MTRPITPRHILRFAISVLVVLAIFALATRAGASQDLSPQTEIDHSPLTPAMLSEWERIHSLYPLWTPAPPEPQPTHTGMGTNVEQWRGLVEVYFSPGDVDLALRIMACESGGNPNAKNPSSSASGLWQHLASYWDGRSVAAGWGGASIWDPEANTAVAAWLRYTDGWGHWNASRHCWG